MTNIRDRIEKDLGKTLEGAFGLPIVLIDPDGNTINESLNGGILKGQINSESIRVNPETGEYIIVGDPNVSIRRSSLLRIPAANEKWLVKIPLSGADDAPIVDFLLSPTRSPEGGRTIGFIRLYLRNAEQTPI